jgi:type VI secretion system Hcp family effector
MRMQWRTAALVIGLVGGGALIGAPAAQIVAGAAPAENPGVGQAGQSMFCISIRGQVTRFDNDPGAEGAGCLPKIGPNSATNGSTADATGPSTDSSATGTGHLVGTYFDFTGSQPIDASGQNTGRRTFTPVTFRHVIGDTSPQLLQALDTNENLSTVVFTLMGTGSEGQHVILYEIRLTNAHVIRVNQYLPDTFAAPGVAQVPPLEQVSMDFQKLEEISPGGTHAAITTG